MPKLPTQQSHFFVFKQAGPISITATEYLQTANSFKLLIHQISSPHTHPRPYQSSSSYRIQTT